MRLEQTDLNDEPWRLAGQSSLPPPFCHIPRRPDNTVGNARSLLAFLRG